MNLSEALDAALPEIPRARLSRKNPPRIDPDLIIREDVTDGEPIVAVYQRSTANLMRLKPTQWQLASLFDGVRSYDEIAVAFEAETAIPLSAEEVRTFAENMDEDGFWYKNPQEKNIAMNEKLAAQRSRRASGQSKLQCSPHILLCMGSRPLSHPTRSEDRQVYLQSLDDMVRRTTLRY